MKIELEHFLLVPYMNLSNQNEFLKELQYDADVEKYLGNIDYLLTKINMRYNENFIDKAYIIYMDDIARGLLTISYKDEKLELACAILSKYRNMGIASNLLRELTPKVFEMYNVDDIYLYIDSNNTASIASAKKGGYVNTGRNEYKISR